MTEAVFEIRFTSGIAIRWYVSWKTARLLSDICEKASSGAEPDTHLLEFGINSPRDHVVIPAHMFETGDAIYKSYDVGYFEKVRLGGQ